MRDFTNRIRDNHAGDQRREDSASGRYGIRESHKRTGKIRTEIHMVDIVAAVSGDIAGHGDDEDAHG